MPIAYAFTEKNTATDNTSASYADLTDCAIADTSFTAGKRYLVLVTAQYANVSAGAYAGLRTLHGSTAFAESEHEHSCASASEYISYAWMTVWTAVASEGIKLQGITSGGTTQRVNYVSILAMQLDDYLGENTDWFFHERSTDDVLSTTPTSGATVTFSPASASDWLVISSAQMNYGDNTTQVISTITRSGEDSSTTPATQIEIQSVLDNFRLHFLTRVFSLGAASNTFTEQSATSTGTAHTRTNSAIFAMNLSKFAASGFAYTDASLAITGTSYAGTELQTTTVAPAVNTNMFILSSWVFDVNSASRVVRWRSQTYVDGGAEADQPANQTGNAYALRPGNGNTPAQEPMALITVMAQTGGSTYRTDLDAYVDSTTGAPAANHRQVVMWSDAMAGSPPMFRGS